MARWDEILSLPVQNPPTLEFSSDDLVWTKVEGWRDNIDTVTLIPFARVDDFVRGESSNKDCPTRFHVEARRRRPPDMSYKPKIDGILEYILYWCSFGPDDQRKGGIVRPSRNTYVSKNKSSGRPNTKRGCTCHFIVKRLIAEPSVALIIYNQDKHVDKKGLPCHGPQDKKAAGTRAMYAPYISEDLRLRVLSLLYVGVPVETIMQRHNESVEKQGGPCNRDDLLTHRYVRRQERSIRRSTYELDEDDTVSIRTWVESHQNHVFFFEDFSDSDPFVLGIQTEWQLQQLIRFGNRGLVASDSSFGTNKLKYPIHSLVVFNSENKAIPIAWIIAPRFSCGDIHRWTRAFYNRVHTKDPTWKLAGFIVDDPLADILTIREVFQCSVLISFWRVRHAWHKNLVKTCSDNTLRAEMSRQLGQAVHSVCRGHGTVDLFENFMEDFVDGSDFMDYFKAIWYPRIGSWAAALKTLPLASQETCASMEFYHNQMKLRLLNEKDSRVYQRADWLIDKLGTKVHSYFWLDECPEKDDFGRYWKEEWMCGLTSWRKSLKIPDSDVVAEGKCVKVIDHEKRERSHIVLNPGSEFSICDCSWAKLGNVCEHVIKIIKVYRTKGFSLPSVSMSQYQQALNNLLHCPPLDSLIRDHAVSLSIWVQNQLDTMVDVENRSSVDAFAENEALIDAVPDIIKNLASKENSVTNRNSFDDYIFEKDSFEDAMDIDPQFVPLDVSQYQCGNVHQNGDKEPSVIPHVVHAEAGGGTEENAGMCMENNNGSCSQTHLSTDDIDVPLAGLQNNNAEDFNLGQSGKEVNISSRMDNASAPVSNYPQLVDVVNAEGGNNDNQGMCSQNNRSQNRKPKDGTARLEDTQDSMVEDSKIRHDEKEESFISKRHNTCGFVSISAASIDPQHSTSPLVSSMCNEIPFIGFGDNIQENSNFVHDANGTDSMMPCCPGSSDSDHPCIELGTRGTCISAEQSCVDEPCVVRCGFQNHVTDSKFLIEVAEGTVSLECLQTSPAGLISHEHQKPADVATGDG